MSFEYFMVGCGWFAALVFVGVAAYRIVRLARLPLNLRWEVYPVPQEPKQKRHYGGSYMEEMDWATTKRKTSSLPAFLEIAAEVLTLKRVREHNRYGVWPLSLAMHWGLYLYFIWLFLLIPGSALPAAGVSNVEVVIGLAAHVLGAVGALGLMLKRATNRELRLYSTPLDYFNLLFLAAMFLAGLVSWLGDTSFAAQQTYIHSVLCFRPTHVPAAVSVSFLLFELFMIYMPFTKLIHYFAKYFTFHHALWDDDFKARGSAVDREVTAQLDYKASWAGPHMVPEKTWLQQAQEAALPESKK